ncbi:MAG: prolyl oligopeptidase family serine peptidase [Acidobacteria bacterium]|nr:prolyl oligopeptidase family serine peptidase [Acidobacteriota bacterium]
MINRRRFCLMFAAGLSFRTISFAQDRGEPFLARIHRNAKGQTIPYRLFVPMHYDKQSKYPLVLWLHGSGGRGTDNRKQISQGNRIGTHVWIKPENQARYPCFVLAPQSDEWVRLDSWEATDELRLTVEIVDSIQREFAIDSRRLYVAGQSMGGYGTWALIAQYPRVFAAAVPIAGGGDTRKASLIAHMPIWAFHGEKDPTVKVEESRNMIEAIRKAGGNPGYTEYEGAGHEIWNRVFREQELLPWVFAQKLK